MKMTYRPLGQLPLAPSRICLGVADFGTSVKREESFRILDTYFSRGGNFFDTAHIYAAWIDGGWGMSEQTLGEWVHSRGLRERVLICSKGAHPSWPDRQPRLTAAAIESDLQESLGRLRTDRIDLYLLHRDDPTVPVDEVIGWLEKHRQAGRILAYGASNWSVQRLAEAQGAARALGAQGWTVSQIGFSLARSYLADASGALFMDEAQWAWHLDSQMPVMGFSAQATGFFSTRNSEEQAAGPNPPKPWMTQRYGHRDNYRRLDVARSLARQRGGTANQIALAWNLQAPFPTYPVIGPKNLPHLEDSLGCFSIRLTDAEWQALHLPPE